MWYAKLGALRAFPFFSVERYTGKEWQEWQCAFLTCFHLSKPACATCTAAHGMALVTSVVTRGPLVVTSDVPHSTCQRADLSV